MDTVLQHYRGNEEFVKRLYDLQDQMQRWNRIIVTPFFSPEQLAIAQRVYGSTIRWHQDGGYAQAERCRMAVLPYEEDYTIPITHLKATYANTFAKLSHRDVLGAIMHLGIEREKVGDMIVMEKEIHIFCDPDITTYIVCNLTKIKRCSLHFSVCDQELAYTAVIKHEQHVVSSLRLDVLVSLFAHVSRAKAQQLIKAGLVKVNHLPLEQTSHLCDNNCVISIRGHGRFQLFKVVKETKKGHLVVETGTYQ